MAIKGFCLACLVLSSFADLLRDPGALKKALGSPLLRHCALESNNNEALRLHTASVETKTNPAADLRLDSSRFSGEAFEIC